MKNTIHFTKSNFNKSILSWKEDRLVYSDIAEKLGDDRDIYRIIQERENEPEKKKKRRRVPQFKRATKAPWKSPRYDRKLKDAEKLRKKGPISQPITLVWKRTREQLRLKLSVRKNLDTYANDADISHIMWMKKICKDIKELFIELEGKPNEYYISRIILFIKHFEKTMILFENRANGAVKQVSHVTRNSKSVLDAFEEIKGPIDEIIDPYNKYISPRMLYWQSSSRWKTEPNSSRKKNSMWSNHKRIHERYRKAHNSFRWLLSILKE